MYNKSVGIIFRINHFINIFMENIYEKDYDLISSITIKQKKDSLTLTNIIEGSWKLVLLKNEGRLYLYNPLYISQVYSDKKIYFNCEKMEFYFNNSKKFINENKIKYNKLKIYDSGFLINDKADIYASVFFGNISGILINFI